MKVLKFMEHHYWVFLLIAIGTGLLFSRQLTYLSNYIIVFMMIILFFVFLKIKMADVFAEAKRPILLIYVVIMHLIIIPFIIYVAFSHIKIPLTESLLYGVLLLVALPVGTSAAAIIELVHGKTSLGLVLTILTCLIAPFSLPAMFYFLVGKTVIINYQSMFFTLLMVIIVPMLASKVIKEMFKKTVAKTKTYYSFITVSLIMLIFMGVTASKAEYIFSEGFLVFQYLIVLFILFFVMQIISYGMVFFLPNEEKIAVATSKIAMNNALGIALAVSFFDNATVVFLILSIIPWVVMPMLFNLSRRVSA